jgi:hypothetical protein
MASDPRSYHSVNTAKADAHAISHREGSKAVRRSPLPKIALILVSGGLLWAGWKYHQIEDDTLRRVNSRVPFDTSGLKRDIAYILDKEEKLEWREGKRTVTWQVKIPASNHVYYCEWDIGFGDFRKNDGVVFLHVPLDAEDGDANNMGYILGIHDAQRGKVTLVNAIEQEAADEAYDAGREP